jgi:hypothetical protein
MNFKQKIQKAFNEFNGKNLDLLEDFYASDIEFHDPVTKCKGLPQLKKYYAHAYAQVKSIRFDFLDFVIDGNTVAATWEMHLAVKGLNGGKSYAVNGFSHFKFNAKGLVYYHRDYLDLGAMVYERLPVQGAIIKGIKKFLKP